MPSHPRSGLAAEALDRSSDNSSDTDISEDSSVNEEDISAVSNTVSINSSMPPGDRLLLLSTVRSLIPKSDKLPFDKRLDNISWRSVAFKNYSAKDVKSEFYRMCEPIRKYRLFGEIIDETQKIILPELGLQKPMPSFVLFLRDNKEEIDKIAQSKKGKVSYSNIAGELFSRCSQKVKNAYKEKAKKMKTEYYQAINAYKVKNIAKQRADKANKVPRKKNDTAVQLYAQTRRLEDPSVSKTALRKEYSSLPKNKQLKWILRWAGVKKGEKANLRQYLKCEKMLSKSEMGILQAYEGRPRFVSAYNLFMKERFNNKTTKTRVRESYRSCTEDWRNLSEIEKAKYVSRASQIRKNFRSDVIRFVASLPEDRRDYEIEALTARKSKGSKIKENSNNKAGDKNTSKLDQSFSDCSTESEDDDDEADILNDSLNRNQQNFEKEYLNITQLSSPAEQQVKLTSLFSHRIKVEAASESDENCDETKGKNKPVEEDSEQQNDFSWRKMPSHSKESAERIEIQKQESIHYIDEKNGTGQGLENLKQESIHCSESDVLAQGLQIVKEEEQISVPYLSFSPRKRKSRLNREDTEIKIKRTTRLGRGQVD